MCSAMLNPSLVFDSFFYGADGVLIAGCHEQDCHYQEGFIKAKTRYESIKEILSEASQPFLLLFGTGWGLTEEVMRNCDYILAPIEGSHYNHLSVRSAAAIILDRLLGHR